MQAYLYLGTVIVGFSYANAKGEGAEATYPFLEELENFVESTTAESGNLSIQLGLPAFRFVENSLGKLVQIRQNGRIFFEGLVTQLSIADKITLQLEA